MGTSEANLAMLSKDWVRRAVAEVQVDCAVPLRAVRLHLEKNLGVNVASQNGQIHRMVLHVVDEMTQLDSRTAAYKARHVVQRFAASGS